MKTGSQANPPRAARMRDERGGTLPLGIVVAFVLVLMLAFAFDMGGQLVLCERNNSDLQICREDLEQVADGFLIKSADNPEEQVAELAIRSLRNQGFSGDILVFAEELPQGYQKDGKTLPDSRRVIAVQICLVDSADAMFARGLGLETLPAYTDLLFSISPYSTASVWRPDDTTGTSSPIRRSYYSLGSDTTNTTVHDGGLSAGEYSKINPAAYASAAVWEDVHAEALNTLKSVS